MNLETLKHSVTPTHTPTVFSKDAIPDNQEYVRKSFLIKTDDKEVKMLSRNGYLHYIIYVPYVECHNDGIYRHSTNLSSMHVSV